MDKRFFLALFLSLIVIAISQLLFPPPKRPAVAKNSGTNPNGAASSTQTATPTSGASNRTAAVSAAADIPAAAPIATTSATALSETTMVQTGRVAYTFTSEGAAPTSVVIRDYQNRSTGGAVDLGTPGLTLLRYYIV